MKRATEQQASSALVCTNVQVYPFKESSGKTKAYARVVLNEQLQLTRLRVVSGVNGYFVSYPLDPKQKAEDYCSIYYPLCKELREHIENEILAKYAEVTGKNVKTDGEV